MAESLPVSYNTDPELYLYTSLTSGSSAVVTATARLQTILNANKIKFKALDVATDEKARLLWGRRSKGKKLPGLVRMGMVLGTLDDVEEWNEYGEIKDNLQFDENIPASDASQATRAASKDIVNPHPNAEIRGAAKVDSKLIPVQTKPEPDISSNVKETDTPSLAKDDKSNASALPEQQPASLSDTMRQLGFEAAKKAEEAKTKARQAFLASARVNNTQPADITNRELRKTDEQTVSDQSSSNPQTAEIGQAGMSNKSNAESKTGDQSNTTDAHDNLNIANTDSEAVKISESHPKAQEPIAIEITGEDRVDQKSVTSHGAKLSAPAHPDLDSSEAKGEATINSTQMPSVEEPASETQESEDKTRNEDIALKSQSSRQATATSNEPIPGTREFDTASQETLDTSQAQAHDLEAPSSASKSMDRTQSQAAGDNGASKAEQSVED